MKRLLILSFSLFLLLSFFVSSSVPQTETKPVIVIPKIEKPKDPYLENLDVARELIRAGKAAEAVNIIQQLRDVYGDNQELQELLKEAYLAAKEYDKVEEMIKSELAQKPDRWILYTQLGSVCLQTQRAEEAKLNFNKAIEIAPDRKQAYREVASVYLRNNLRSEAMDTYKLARMRLGEPSLFCFELANLYEGLFDYKQAIDEYFLFMGGDSTKFDLVEDRINQLIQTDQHLDEIELALGQRIKNNPKDRYSQKLYGDLLFRRKDLKGAMETYQRVDELFKAGGKFIILFIQMCVNQGYFDQAIQSSQYLLSTHPAEEMQVSARLFVAYSYVGLGRFTDAIGAYQQIIDDYQGGFDREVALCHFQIGAITLFELKNPDEAYARFQNVVRDFKGSDRYAAALIGLGDCMMAKGELDSARILLEQALSDPRAEPRREEIRYKLIDIDFFQGKFEEALEGYQKLVVDFPRGFYVNNSLERIIVIGENQELDRPMLSIFAQALLEKIQGKDESAISKLDNIISAKSKKLSDLAQLEKGKIYRTEKKFSESLKAFEELLKEYPESYFCAQAQKLIGDVYNYDLKDKARAIEAYQKLLKKYDRSVYMDETRDKLRELQADQSPSSSG